MSADSKASPHVNGEAFDATQALDPSRALTPAVARVNERRVARGFRNYDNYRLRMLLIGGGLQL